MKKRILLVNEASFLSTGFSVYGLEILSRLHETGKYDIAEFGVYAQDEDARWRSLPWKFYPNQPSNEAELDVYNSRPGNQFGEWRFEKTCLQFKPHIVWDIRDWWMVEFQERSPFRPFFKWVLMPTVDSAPQDENWIASYLNADSIHAYSEFGLETLTKQSGGLMKLQGIAPPGANLSDFPFVTDRKGHKKQLGMPDDTFIIGTVMRNQERKLYPDLIEAFGMFLKQAPAELAKKSFLYLHTMYPDVGWHIPRFLKEEGLVNKTLFTYICQQCQATFPSFYQDARTHCRNCGSYSATLPGVQVGTSREALGKILNIFDVYVQYAVCEGFGMPLVEAAACGTPILAVDYSAMADIIKKLGGMPITVQRMFRDPKTHTKRALPDNQDLVNKLIEVSTFSTEYRLELSRKLRAGVELHYSWDKTAKTWEECFDSIEVLPDEVSWASPSRITQPNMQCPQNMTNDEFVQWAIMNVAGRPELLNTYVALRLTRDLNWGASQVRPGRSLSNDNSFGEAQPKWASYDRNSVVQEMLKACEHKNSWEQARLGGFTNG
jgi:glycosyltransferase involved in cell wall biosynthesis